LAYFSLISFEVSFEAVKILIAVSSVKIFPEFPKTSKILFSISVNYFLFSAPSTIIFSLAYSSSGLSLLTNIPNN